MYLLDEIRYKNTVFAKIKIKARKIKEKKSKFQKIEIYDSLLFGKILSIDNDIQLTEKDEAIYHHQMTKEVKRNDDVLIIGGGDGGIARDCLKRGAKSITIVEIDREVYKLCLKYFPETALAFTNKKCKIVFDDGMKFLKKDKKILYDIIISDHNEYSSIDFKTLHKLAKQKLKRKGIIISHLGTGIEYLDDESLLLNTTKEFLEKQFSKYKIENFHVPSWYPGNFWKTISYFNKEK